MKYIETGINNSDCVTIMYRNKKKILIVDFIFCEIKETQFRS